MGVIVTLTSIIGSLGAFFYRFFNHQLHRWKENGVPYVQPVPLFGNMFAIVFRKRAWTDHLQYLYNKIPGNPRYFGLHDFGNPLIMVRDPVIIKSIMSDSFSNFSEHPTYLDEKVEPLMTQNVYILTGDKWKDMRATMLPIFSPANLIDRIERTARQFADCLESFDTTTVDMKDAFSKYTVDVIASTVFGRTVNSLVKDKNEFLAMTLKIWSIMGGSGPLPVLKIYFVRAFPRLTETMKLSLTPRECREFFRNLTRSTIRSRTEQSDRPHDLIDVLMTARDNETGAHELDVEDITAQAFSCCFKALPVTLSLSFMAYDIAKNPEVQRRLQEEIDRVLGNSGKLAYEALRNMRYLDMVFNESLRIHAPIPYVARVCTKSYTLPPAFHDAKPYTISSGTMLWIPLQAIQKDANYFPDPEKFDPERFTAENRRNLQPFTYFPWSEGPRLCLGSKFAELQMKMILVHLLARFNFGLTPEMERKDAMENSRNYYYLQPKSGFRLRLERRVT